MGIRKNLDLHDPRTILGILGRISDAVKIGLWLRGRWKNADEWNKWTTRVILAKTFIALPALGIGVVGTILLFRYNVPPNDQFGAISSEYMILYLVSAFFFLLLVADRSLNRWLGRRMDLQVPVYRCIRNYCFGNLLYHEVEKAGRICPYCKGEVRLLSAQEKRRPY